MKKKLTVGALAVGLMFSPVASSAYHGTSTPSTYSSPTTTFGSSAYSVARTAQGMTFEGKVSGHERVTLRVSASPITTQTGWYYPNVAVGSDGNVRIVANEQGAEKNLYWQLESASDRNNIITSGAVSPTTSGTTPTPSPSPSETTEPAPAPAPTETTTPSPTPSPTNTPAPVPTNTPTPPPATGGDFTNGSGGAKTVQLKQSFTSNGMTSQYHVYAEGLDWSKKVGLMVYADGSGAYGWKNPTQSYLVGGANGLAAVAKKHNMVLLMPLAPAPGCPTDNCWYDGNGPAKAQWSADLVKKIHGQYNIDKSRTAFGGYSSGAEWTANYFGPTHAPSIMTDGVGVAISYGGYYGRNNNITPEFKSNVPMIWDVGSNDGSALTAARRGHSWYTNQGFKTELNIVQGEDHGRSGQFGPIMDREITQHVKPA